MTPAENENTPEDIDLHPSSLGQVFPRRPITGPMFLYPDPIHAPHHSPHPLLIVLAEHGGCALGA